MANLLVTGGAGYIGSHTAHYLLSQGHHVVVADNLSRGYAHNVPEGRLRRVSLQDQPALTQILREESIEAVVHFAAFIAVGESTQKPELYFQNNVGASLCLLNAMVDAGVSRLVFSSTAAVYGNTDLNPIPEEAPKQPINPYGHSKLMVEQILEWMDQFRGFRSVVLRYFNACGAEPAAGLGEEHEPETHLIPLILRAALTGKPITVFGDDYPTADGSCVRDYIHVMDLASAHAAAVDHLLRGGASRQFNVGTGQGLSVFEVIQAVEEATGRPVPRTLGARRAGDPATLVADSRKLQSELGWRPTRSSVAGIVRDAWEFESVRAKRRAG